MTDVQKAFEKFDNGKLWRPEDRFLDGFPQAYFEAGYKAGATANTQGDLEIVAKAVSHAERAERERVLKEIKEVADRQTGYDVADGALESVMEVVKKLRGEQ